MKTREEVEYLKQGWKEEPEWNIYETEGFEEYREELKIYQEEQEALWKKQREENDKQEAFELGIDIKTLPMIKDLMYQSQRNRENAKRTLTHYFNKSSVMKFDSECVSEIRDIVDNIIDCAISEVSILLLKKEGKNG